MDYLKKVHRYMNLETEAKDLAGTVHYLRFAILNLMYHLEEQATPQSGSTSPESAGASPEATTEPLEKTASSSAPTSSLSERGQRLEDWAIRETRLQMSKMHAPTSSTPSTDRSTGPSVAGDKDWAQVMHPWYGPCDGLGHDGRCAECQKVSLWLMQFVPVGAKPPSLFAYHGEFGAWPESSIGLQ